MASGTSVVLGVPYGVSGTAPMAATSSITFEAVGEGKRFRFCGGFLRRFGSLFRSFGFLCGRFRRLLGRSLFGLRGVVRSRLLLAGCAAGHERGEHCKHKQKRKNSSFHFRTSCEW